MTQMKACFIAQKEEYTSPMSDNMNENNNFVIQC